MAQKQQKLWIENRKKVRKQRAGTPRFASHNRKYWWEVACPVHGKKEDNTGLPVLKIGEPKPKENLTGGCPLCNAEK